MSEESPDDIRHLPEAERREITYEHRDDVDTEHERDLLRAELNRVRQSVWAFLDHQDVHEPGEFVKDGNWHYGPCVEGGPRMEDVYPDGFQVCADEDCGEYWPCSVEELRRAVFPDTAQLGSQEQR